MKWAIMVLMLAPQLALSKPIFGDTDNEKFAVASTLFVTVGYSMAREMGLKKKNALLATVLTTTSINLITGLLVDHYNGDKFLASVCGTAAGALLMAPIVYIEF